MSLTIITIVAGFEDSRKCAFGNCDNSKQQNSEYCYSHTCGVSDCTNSKSRYGKYCYIHEEELCCAVEDCGSDKIAGGEYCYSHTCEKQDCYSKKFYDTSASGIEFDFKARNFDIHKIYR